MKITRCPISGSEDSKEFLNLGEIPLVNNLCKTRQESLKAKRYPLILQYFKESKLTCLTEIPEKEELFTNYLYNTGINKPYLQHCSEMYDYLSDFLGIERWPNPKDIFVIDVGGNDGSLLNEFRKKNPEINVMNIDASVNFFEANTEKSIPYLNKFFSEDTDLGQKAYLIISTNVFQHNAPIRSFVRGICKNLAKNGVWCLEFPYFLTTIINDNYDQVYHEHVYYYLLQNIIDLISQEGLRVVNVSYRHEIHAGALRVISVRDDSVIQPDTTIASFLGMEKTLTFEYCKRWGKLTGIKIKLFRMFLNKLMARKKIIFGFGAAAKGCVFLNSIEADYNIIPYIIDDTPAKQGKFVPGTGIEIVSREILKLHKPDFILILAHNFKDYIIDSLKSEYTGKFIVMFPEIQVL